MGFLGLNWGDVAVGAASAAGFMVGGPVGGALVGALAGGISAGVDGRSIWKGMALEGALGAIPGGMFGGATKNVIKGGLKNTLASVTSIKTIAKTPAAVGGTPMQKLGTYAVHVRSNSVMPRLHVGASVAGVSTMGGNLYLSDRFSLGSASAADPNAAKKTYGVAQIPTTQIYP